MLYTVVRFDLVSASEWQQEILLQQLADIGFDAFDGSDAYIQTALFDAEKLDEVIRTHESVRLLSVEQCPDENWNATWEDNHAIEDLPMGVRIIPHCAFGAGHHETTSMMIAHLIESHNLLDQAKVLDMGCGTGVLGIFAAKMGAAGITAVDIDDKSVENTRENIEGNHLDLARFTLLCQSTVPKGPYNLILANIHRNILLDQMADYAHNLLPEGQVWMSGFYQTDIPCLIEAAAKHGLRQKATYNQGDWCMLCFEK